jgi:hypothetical protein
VDKNLNSTAQHVVSPFLLNIALVKTSNNPLSSCRIFLSSFFSLPSPAAYAAIRLAAVCQAAACVDPVAASPLHPYTTADAAVAEQLHGGAAPVGRSSWTVPLPRPRPPWPEKGCRWSDFLLTLLGWRPVPLSDRPLSSEAAGGGMEHVGDLLSYVFPGGFKWRGRASGGVSPSWLPPPPGVGALRPLQRGHSRHPELSARRRCLCRRGERR